VLKTVVQDNHVRVEKLHRSAGWVYARTPYKTRRIPKASRHEKRLISAGISRNQGPGAN
jgi:hypothetical protein